MEVWKDIPGYEGVYQASSQGNIKRLPTLVQHNKGGLRRNAERTLRQMSNRGYKNVMLSHGNIQKVFRVHRLIALTFLPIVEDKPYVNHKNGIRHDNRLENLEWCNNSENQKHSYAQLQRVNPKGGLGKTGALCKNSKPVLQIDSNGNVVKEWDAIADACRQMGYNQSALSRSCKNGVKAYGYLWSFKLSA